ncbi:hypothetical protein CYMTET_6912 [Cymbomonas tetramitiformis]|uniref:Uncharacterized protein n=1 Tax=Cymbomonas tetramitiformis TaxID=36881 RepID=A0AAE0GWH2_9CHLO|nr:hypothetical protein CYMTET_6912 [Cymbomonas tetramitiformis]
MCAPAENELPAAARVRQKFEDGKSIVNAIYSKGRHRKWAKAIKQHLALGGEYFDASDDVSKLAKVIVALKAQILTAGLDPDVFDMDEPTLVVHPCINELVYDTLGYIVEPDSVAYGSSESAGGTFFPHVPRNPAKADPRPILAKGQRRVRENRAADWTSTATTSKQRLWESLDPDFYAAIRDDLILKLFAKIERIENFVKSQRQGGAASLLPKRTRKGLSGYRVGSRPDPQYGAPAVLKDGASAGGVDISAYGFATGESEDSDDEGMDVKAELQQLRRDVTAATEVSMV